MTLLARQAASAAAGVGAADPPVGRGFFCHCVAQDSPDNIRFDDVLREGLLGWVFGVEDLVSSSWAEGLGWG